MYEKFRCPDAVTQAKIDALPKMNPVAKKRWVDALLSGEYKQGRRALRPTKDTFCCLGVAADVFKGKAKLDWRSPRYSGGKYSMLGSSGIPPTAIGKVMGLPDANPEVYYKGHKQSVASLNDNGVDFEMIAGLIINQL